MSLGSWLQKRRDQQRVDAIKLRRELREREGANAEGVLP